MKNNRMTPMISALTWALSLGALLLATGCNSSDSGAGPAGGNPHGMGIANCDALLTSAEAAVILGGPIVKITPRDTGNILNCTYDREIPTGDFFAPEIRISAFTTDGFLAPFHSTAPAFYDALDARTAASIKTTLTGIGTKAMYQLNPRKLSLYKGDVYAEIYCRPHGIPAIDTSVAAFEGAKAAAVNVAAKL